MREARRKGLVEQSTSKKRKLDKAETITSTTVDGPSNSTNDNIVQTELSHDELQEKKKWLGRFNKPWELVEKNWNATIHFRRDQLLACKALLPFMRDEWPLLASTEYGPILVSYLHLHQRFLL